MDIIHIQAIALWISSLGLLVYSFFRPVPTNKQPKITYSIIGIFLYALSTTVLLGGMTWNTLFAPSQMWTGALSVAAGILIAWLAAPRLSWKTLTLFFYVMGVVAVASLLYGLPIIIQGNRLGGIVVQPNVLAIILGTGLIAGLYSKDNIRLPWRLVGLLPIIIAILLTQTRAVIIALPLIIIPFVLMKVKLNRRVQLWLAGLIIVTTLILTPRLTDLERLKYGITYRYDLAVYSVQYTRIMPPWGFGPGGLLNVAGDYYELPPSLKRTAEIDQTLPESSHVIIIDRFIEYGWLGGFSYLAIIVVFFVEAYKKRDDEFTRVLAAIGIFVLIQQLVTVARFHTELLAWVAMLGVIMYPHPSQESKNV